MWLDPGLFFSKNMVLCQMCSTNISYKIQQTGVSDPTCSVYLFLTNGLFKNEKKSGQINDLPGYFKNNTFKEKNVSLERYNCTINCSI